MGLHIRLQKGHHQPLASALILRYMEERGVKRRDESERLTQISCRGFFAPLLDFAEPVPSRFENLTSAR